MICSASSHPPGRKAVLPAASSVSRRTLLWASKAAIYGPFPNANMMGAMGLSRSFSLENMMITGWSLLIPASLMYAIIMFVETR